MIKNYMHIKIFTTVKKYGDKVFLCMERSLLCSLRLHLFKQKYNKTSNIVKCYYDLKEVFSIFNIFQTVIY